MTSLFTMLSDQVRALWKQFREETDDKGLLPLLQPVPPYSGPVFQNPLTTLGILLALVATSGIAVAAIGVLLVALLALYFLMTEVLGVSIEVRPFPV